MDASPLLHFTLTLEDIAAAAWEACRTYRFLEGDQGFYSWLHLSPEDRAYEVRHTFDVLTHPTMTPEEWHERWCMECQADGWTFDYVDNFDEKKDSNLVPWDDLRILDRNSETVRWSAIMALGMRTGFIDMEAVNMANEAAAEKMNETFMEDLNNGQ